ncbi:MAG: hypothetical protein J5509_01485 [Lachnospiraceae bacterium]|nr:hypothetical protein [Lachnospiraceae bacterium]
MKLKHKLFDDWGLKLGSVVFAILVWFIVTNFNDPVVQYRVYNVKVSFRNTNVITDQGQTYEVLDDTNVIDTVTVTGPRSVIDALNEENIVAVADFKDLTLQNTVAIKLSTNKYSSQIESIRGTIDTVQLNIENLKTKTLALSTVTSGTVSDGYTIGEVTTDENQVRISGPESVIDEIVRAEVNVPVTGFSQDIITDVDIVLMDANGEPVQSGYITSNISKVRVKVELLQTKRVGVVFSTSGTAADGYEATGTVTCDPDTILVAGRASVLQNLDNIVVEDPINITGQAGNMMTLVDIKDSLPSGVKLADTSFDGKISVTVYIDKTTTRMMQLSADEIRWVNVPEGYTVEIVDPEDKYNVTFEGLQKNLDALQVSNIIASADLQNILEQEDTVGDHYHVVLDFESEGSRVDVSTPVQVWIKLNET